MPVRKGGKVVTIKSNSNHLVSSIITICIIILDCSRKIKQNNKIWTNTSMIKDLGSISRALKTWFLPIVSFPSQLPKFFNNERSSELDFISSDPRRTWEDIHRHWVRLPCNYLQLHKYEIHDIPCSSHTWLEQSLYSKPLNQVCPEISDTCHENLAQCLPCQELGRSQIFRVTTIIK